MNNKYFVSVDWGTSNFRLRVVERDGLRIVEESSVSDGGAKSLYDRWKTQGGSRENIFLDFLQDRILQLKTVIPVPTRVVISGMASSSIGLRELPYARLPFAVDGNSIFTENIPSGDHCKHDILLISGIRSEQDVARGEETQLIGCFPDDEESTDTLLFIFPGTHSKHFFVKGRSVVDFKTYMTGEFFELLAMKSVLSSSVDIDHDLRDPQTQESYKKGVRAAVNANLLNASFRVRTHSLFAELNKGDNLEYLSGLLIGTELQDLLKTDLTRIYLAGGINLNMHYQTALETLGLYEKASVFSPAWLDKAVIKGHHKMLLQDEK